MRPLILCILDGFGHSEKEEYNAVYQARTPNIDELWDSYPHTLLQASGLAVGLPEGQMGNSEVGHIAIGIGRTIYQDLPRISLAIKDKTIRDIPELQDLISKLKKNGGSCHLWGLLSDGGIHSHIEHLFGIADILLENGIKLFVHACTDGRDTPPQSAKQYIDEFHKHFKWKLEFATFGGRYYHMDRDKRWDRIQKAYDSMVSPTNFCKSPEEYIDECYADGIYDEFLPPVALEGYDGIKDGDAFIAFNFRTDRVRQMLSTFLDGFSGFERSRVPQFSTILGVTEYSTDFRGKIGVMFKHQESKNSLGEVIANNGLTQLRVAETEKYPHVTFFFNGGIETPFKNENRIMIDSPKVATYDLAPKMSARGIADAVISELKKKSFDLCVVNFANPDMVGHTGNFDAVVEAIEFVDSCVGEIRKAIHEVDGSLIVTADHGNAEIMYNEDAKQPHTAHTTNPVIFILADDHYKNNMLAESGGLRDIAPTILDVMGIEKPSEMTGNSLKK